MTAANRLAWLLFAVSLLGCSCHAYSVRLFFENATTGQSNTGAVSASPGDEIRAHLTYHGDHSLGERWTIAQIILCTGGNQIIEGSPEWTGGGFGSWTSQIQAAFQPSSHYPTLITYVGQCIDNGVDPGDSAGADLYHECSGLYALIGVGGNYPESQDIDVVVFRFHAGMAKPGTSLHFGFEGRDTDVGLSTRVIEFLSGTLVATDNYVWEPGQVVTVPVQVILDDLSAPSSRWIRMRYYPFAAGSYDSLVPVDSNGNGQLTLPTGSCRVSAETTHWLRHNADLLLTTTPPPTVQFELPNGDAYYDGRIDLFDLSQILSGFGLDGQPYTSPGASQPYADLTEDGKVDLLDFSTVLGDFGMTSDPASP